jgi:hypothetical protein
MKLIQAFNQVYREAQGDDNKRPAAVLKGLKQNTDWSDDEKNEFITEFWITTNFPSHHTEIWKEIFSLYPISINYKLENSELEPLKIYRGASSIGFSWTTDIQKAIWFCNRNKEMGYPKSTVFKAVVNRNGILFESDDRSESEVVIEFWRNDIWTEEPIEFLDLLK